MQVHRCPHCNKPFLESEVADGYCPVCRKWVREEAEPEPAPPETGQDRGNPEVKRDPGPAPVPSPERAPEPGIDAKPDAETGGPSTRHDEIHDAPAPSSPPQASRVVPLLLLIILVGAIAWWFQVRDLAGRLHELEEQSETAVERAENAERLRSETEQAATRALTEALDKEDLAERMQAALALAKTDPDHQESRAILSEGMQRDPTWAEAVSQLTPPPQWAVSTLVTILQQPNPEARRLAAEAIGRIRPADPISRIALTRATRDRDATVRTAARKALAAIQPAE